MVNATKKSSKSAGTAAGSVNKAEAIRTVAKEMGGKKVRPKDVISALAEKGIAVSSAQVSMTLKAAGYRRTRRAKRGSGDAASAAKSAGGRHRANGLSLEHLLAAKALATKLGSVEAAQKALEALARLA